LRSCAPCNASRSAGAQFADLVDGRAVDLLEAIGEVVDVGAMFSLSAMFGKNVSRRNQAPRPGV
jgi:hypothetical protein